LNPSELAFGMVVVPVLVGLALFFGWQQVRTLRRLSGNPDISLQDSMYLRRQARRRLACSVLMFVLAGLLVGSYFLDAALRQVLQERAEQAPRDEEVPIQGGHWAFVQNFTAYWILVLLVLMIMLFLVAMDFWEIARYSQRQHRQLRADLQDTLAREVAQLRQRRNGQR